MIRIVVLVVIVLAAIGLIVSSAGPTRAAEKPDDAIDTQQLVDDLNHHLQQNAAAAAAAAASDPAASAKPDDSLPVCAATLDQVIDTLAKDGAQFAILPDELLADFLEIATENGLKVEGTVTKVLLAVINGYAVFGVEVDGRCFSNPLVMNFEFNITPAKLSGKQPNGQIFA